MKEYLQILLASLALWTGIGLGLLNLADILLSTKQKSAIREASIHLWYWLSKQRGWDYISMLRNRWVFRGLSIVLSIFLIPHATRVYETFLNFASSPIAAEYELKYALYGVFLLLILLFCVLLWRFGYSIYCLALPENKPKTSIFIITVLVAISVASIENNNAIALYVINLVASDEYGTWGIALAILFLIARPIMDFAIYLSILLIPALYAGIFIPLVMALLRLAEFIAIRIAEHEKGPVFAVSALLTAIGSLAKAFAT